MSPGSEKKRSRLSPVAVPRRLSQSGSVRSLAEPRDRTGLPRRLYLCSPLAAGLATTSPRSNSRVVAPEESERLDAQSAAASLARKGRCAGAGQLTRGAAQRYRCAPAIPSRLGSLRLRGRLASAAHGHGRTPLSTPVSSWRSVLGIGADKVERFMKTMRVRGN